MALIIPEVFAGIVREKMVGKVKVGNLAISLGYLQNTTVGDTVTFPKFKWIGDTETMVKGTPLTPDSLDQDSSQAKIKQEGKAVRIFDIDNITAMGNQKDEAATQMGIKFARTLDLDLIGECITAPFKVSTASEKAITAVELNLGINKFGDEQDTEDIAGIVVNSLLADSFYNMDEFVDKNKTYNTDGNGIVRNGMIGYFRNIPVFLADHSKGAIGTYDSVKNECVSYIIKKGALGYMEKRGINIEESRQALLKASDIVGDYIYAVKRLDDSGIVVLRKTIV